MRILILTMNVGGNAPGIVFERLIYGLAKLHKVDVYTANYDSNIRFDNSCQVTTIKYFDIHPRLKKFFINIFCFNPFDLLWALKVRKKIYTEELKYDIVFSLISMNHYASLETGNLLSDKNKKWAVYSVDAIPSPEGWSKSRTHRKNLKCLLNRNIKNADAFFSANEMMLEYEKSIFKEKNNCLFDVIYNPTITVPAVYEKSSGLVFLFTGGIYGARKVTYLFEAFKLLLVEYPAAELHFVGTVIADADLKLFDDHQRKSVFIHPRVTDLTPYYKNAFALVDIDADLENDVFLSSKIINYLAVNRPIISETGSNSPSKQIFRNIPSIKQCAHNPVELFMAMKNLIEFPVTNFDDRAEVIKLFDNNNIVLKISHLLERLTSN